MGKFAEFLWGKVYFLSVLVLFPLNVVLAVFLRNRFTIGSVAHIGEMSHLHHDFVAWLKSRGINAVYIARGMSPHWAACDHQLEHLGNPLRAVVRDTIFFWRVLARNQVVHCHRMMGLSPYQWEFPLLKLMGRRVVAHFRGCEARDRERNMALHPKVNICQACDYAPRYLCAGRESVRRRLAAKIFADVILVTTPDLLDFFPEAVHLPFSPPDKLPTVPEREFWSLGAPAPFRIVHITNQPGIEGTNAIRRSVEELIEKGWSIEFVHLTGVAHRRVLEELSKADLSVGKMKMGYYANVQVESLAHGVPAVTWVRDDLMMPEMENCGFVFSTLDDWQETLEDILQNPEKLRKKREETRSGIARLHNTDTILKIICSAYGWNGGDSGVKHAHLRDR